MDDADCFAPESACAESVPAAQDACLPPCGNPIGVGQPCTEGGGECGSWSYFERGEAGFCTVDFRDVPLGYCSMPCDVDEDCGCGAVCVPDPDGGATKGCRIEDCSS
jgi:hypothetical protein